MVNGETTILLVENRACGVLSRKESLQKSGYRIFTAETGKDAAAILNDNPSSIDIVLMCICSCNREELSAAAAEMQKDNDIPVIFLQNNTEEEVINKLRRISERLNSVRDYRSYLELSPFGVFICDQTGRYQEVNQAASDITGYTREELLSYSIPDLLPPDTIEYAVNLFKTLLETGSIADEFSFLHKDGSRRIWSLNAVKLSEHRYMGIVNDITMRKATEKKMAHTLSMLRSTMESTADGIVVADGKGKLVRYNQKFGEIWRLPDELIEEGDEDAVLNYVLDQVNDPGAFVKEIRDLYNDPERSSFDVLELKDGRVIERYSQPQRIGNEVIGRVWSFSDRTEQRRAEEEVRKLLNEKEIILREVHHRIKNNMSTISSLLALQASVAVEPKASAALEDASRRVKSMMLLYNKLYDSPLRGEMAASNYLPALIDEILGNFPHSNNITLEKEIGDFVLSAKQLQSLGILINELMTNIMKYAFSDGRDGLIRIKLTLQGNTVTLMVEDNGSGMPRSVDFKNSDGFGLMLVNLLTDQLNGRIGIVRESGTKVILEFEI